jgi:hypothetical protein
MNQQKGKKGDTYIELKQETFLKSFDIILTLGQKTVLSLLMISVIRRYEFPAWVD